MPIRRVAAVALIAALGAGCADDDDVGARPPDRSSGADDRGAGVERYAEVHASREEGCRELRLSERPSRVISGRVADADVRALQTEFRERRDTGVILSGLSQCAGQPVVTVGVADAEVDVPRSGPKGTPVIAYLQQPITPLGPGTAP